MKPHIDPYDCFSVLLCCVCIFSFFISFFRGKGKKGEGVETTVKAAENTYMFYSCLYPILNNKKIENQKCSPLSFL